MNTTKIIFNEQKTTYLKTIYLTLICGLFFVAPIFAQTTEFTYQGKLSDTGALVPSYDFVFRLCASESASCSTPLATSIQNGVPVSSSGIFIVKLDFGATNFNGAARFLEIAVRRANEGSYVTLAPRQKLTSAPYAIQALNTESFGNLGVSDFVQDNDPRVQPNNYVQNATTAQPNVNFNIGGTGTANILNATTQFSLGGERILGGAAGTDNLFAGRNSGATNAGSSNSFFGTNSGRLNTGNNNAFFGAGAGEINTSGLSNSFFGGGAGASNTSGKSNSFFGASSGVSNSQGDNNAFFGNSAGILNATGGNNTFFGDRAGTGNVSGGNNTIIGANANVGANNLSNAGAFGARAFVTQSNSLVLGSINGINGATADTRVGIGTTAPAFKLQIVDSSNTGFRVQTNLAGGTIASFGGNGAFQIDAPSVAGGRLNILENGNVGIGNNAPLYKLDVVGSTNEGLRVRNTNPGGTVASFGNTGAFRVDSTTATGGRLSILENGNVGIGDSTPEAKLSVTGSGPTSTALEINNGGIKVTGAGLNTQTAVFIIERNAANTCGDWTVIDSPYSNNDPNAILFVTAVLPQRVPQTLTAGIYYETNFSSCPQFNNKWVINSPYGGNGTPRFNVMIIKR